MKIQNDSETVEFGGFAAHRRLTESGTWSARRRFKRRSKLVSGVAELLRVALVEGERLECVCSGVDYNDAEFYFTGVLAAVYTNRTTLVITDRRVLLFNASRSGTPRDLKNQIRSEAIRRVRTAFTGRLTLYLADGKKRHFYGIPRAERSVLKQLFPRQRDKTKASTASLEHLCPRCLNVVDAKPGSLDACPHPGCKIPYRRAKTAAFYSAILPGVGDLYLRHYLFGCFELIVSVVVLLVAFWFVVEGSVDMISLSLFVLLPRLIDVPLTLHMARKGFVPLSYEPPDHSVRGPGLRPRALPAFPGWTRALLIGAVLALGLGVAASLRGLQGSRAVDEAIALVGQGQFEAAEKKWRQVEAGGFVSNNKRGALALALYRAGDFETGDEVLARIGEAEINVETADAINAEISTFHSYDERLAQGIDQLLNGQEVAAWKTIAPTLIYYRDKVHAPRLPRTRDEVRTFVAYELAKTGYRELATQLLSSIESEDVHWLEDARQALAEPLEADR